MENETRLVLQNQAAMLDALAYVVGMLKTRPDDAGLRDAVMTQLLEQEGATKNAIR